MSDYTGYYGRATTPTVYPTIPSNAAGGGTAPPGVANPVGVPVVASPSAPPPVVTPTAVVTKPPKGPAVEDGGTFAWPSPTAVVTPPPVVTKPPVVTSFDPTIPTNPAGGGTGPAPPTIYPVSIVGKGPDTINPTIPTNPAGGGTGPGEQPPLDRPPTATPATPATPVSPSVPVGQPAPPTVVSVPTTPTTPTPPTPTGPVTNPYGVVDPTYVPKGQEMLTGAEQSYGKNATDTLNMATAAGRQFGDIAAGEGGRAATGYARASGLSPAQAALLAGQGAEGAYSGGLGQGVDKYMGAARDISSLGLAEQGQGLQKYGLDLGKYGTDVSSQGGKYGIDINDATQRYGIEKGVQTQGTSSLFNLLGAGVGGVASWLASPAGIAFLASLPVGSDENMKTDIKDGYGILERVTKFVNPKMFKYKAGVGEDSSKPRVGVMAQDLEKTPLSSTVVTGPDGYKRVDTGQLTLGNTAMITELSDKLDKVFQYLKAQ